MAKDFTVMKTSLFGGFKKSDVLNLIEQLQAETSEVKESLDIKREEVLELKNKISTLEEKLEDLSGLADTIQEKAQEIAELNEKKLKKSFKNCRINRYFCFGSILYDRQLLLLCYLNKKRC